MGAAQLTLTFQTVPVKITEVISERLKTTGNATFSGTLIAESVFVKPSKRLYKSVTDYMPNLSDPKPQRRGSTIIAAGLLLVALALVVLYTQRVAFLSPVALVVIAAIGVAALLLQLRLRPDLLTSGATPAPLWLNAVGVGFAIAAVVFDIVHLSDVFMLIVALAAVACFAVSGIIVLSALRKRRT